MRTFPWILILFLLAICGCEEQLGATANSPTTYADVSNHSDSGQVSKTDSSPEADAVPAEDIPPDPCSLCSADQICQTGTCVTKPDPCADWNWMKAYQWKCPKALNLDIKFQLQVKQSVCRATSKIFDLPASELVCDKENKGFSFYEPQMNNTFSCVPIE